MNPWPHQEYGVAKTLEAASNGFRRIVLTSPTGGGKTRMMHMLTEATLDRGKCVSIYTNRKMLMDQLIRSFEATGHFYGVRAAGHTEDDIWPLQLSSIQTEWKRRNLRDLHPAELVLVDEGHLYSNPTGKAVLDRHLKLGGYYVLITATPLGLGDMADIMIQAGTTSSLIACKALLPVQHFGPDEPDLRAFRGIREGKDLTEQQQKKAMEAPGLFGRVLEWYGRTNPDRRPSILFAAGVEESIGFAQDFTAAGIRAAHIDGEDIWLDGEFHKSSRKMREQVLEASKDGSVKIICNRFVMREGIDCPWLTHGIFATVFGSVQSYLQSGGRLMRWTPGVEFVTIQDHGGNWWRHGSLNDDREWRLTDTNESIAGLRNDAIRNKWCRRCGQPSLGKRICENCKTLLDLEPKACPLCAKIMLGRRCSCGYVGDKKARKVVQSDGKLIELTGDIFKPRRITNRLDGPAKWRQMYHRSCSEKGAKTFRQAAALFAAENDWGWPDPTWPLMPKNPDDWQRLVGDVPLDDLR